MEPNVGFLNANYNVNGVEFYIRYKTDGSNSASNGAYAYRICDGGKKYLYSTSTSNGNGLLKYPIGLITRAEANYTGYKSSVAAGSHYLLNSGFTLSPSVDFTAYNSVNNYIPLSRIYYLGGSGISYNADTSGIISRRITPVVSFKMSNKIISGTGAIDNPFVFGGA